MCSRWCDRVVGLLCRLVFKIDISIRNLCPHTAYFDSRIVLTLWHIGTEAAALVPKSWEASFKVLISMNGSVQLASWGIKASVAM